jgi:surfactin family lipopeptide synthetase A
MKRLPNGDLLYVQRKDWMVKINGQRVEPGEVEAVMMHIPRIKNAIVKGFTSDDLTRQYLVGYYISEDGNEIPVDFLQTGLKKKLPSYMVPQYFVHMDKFPLNANNKTDRKSLLPPDLSSLRSDYVAPKSELEKELCDAFAEVLHLDKVGIDDNFVQLGGDSIRLMQLQQTLSVNVPTNVILNVCTPRLIAKYIAETTDDEAANLQQDDYPLSTVQSFFLDAALSNLNSTASYFPILHKFTKKIEVEKLCRAVETAVNAHPGLLITIHEDKEKGRRIIPYTGTWTLAVERMSDTEMEREKKLLFKSFKFIDEPMFFARVIETESAVYLYHQMHHIVTDGVSNEIFRNDIAAAYNGGQIEKESTTIYELNAYNDRLRKGKMFEECVQWFKKEFEGSLPGKDMVVEGEMKTLQRELAVPSHIILQGVCNQKDITLNVLFTSCVAFALGEIRKQKDIRLTTSFHGRVSRNLTRTIGFVASPRLYRLYWHDNESIDNYLNRSKMHIMGNISHSIFTTKDVFAYTHIPQDAVMFIYQGTLSRPILTLDDITAETTRLPVEAPPTRPLIIFIHDADSENFRITIDYDTSQYCLNDVEQIAAGIENCLKRIMNVEYMNEI